MSTRSIRRQLEALEANVTEAARIAAKPILPDEEHMARIAAALEPLNRAIGDAKDAGLLISVEARPKGYGRIPGSIAISVARVIEVDPDA